MATYTYILRKHTDQKITIREKVDKQNFPISPATGVPALFTGA